MLIGEHHERLGLLEVRVELGAEALLELVGLPAGFRLRLEQRLHGEQVRHLTGLSSSIAARIAGVAKFSRRDDDGLKLMAPSRLFG